MSDLEGRGRARGRARGSPEARGLHLRNPGETFGPPELRFTEQPSMNTPTTSNGHGQPYTRSPEMYRGPGIQTAAQRPGRGYSRDVTPPRTDFRLGETVINESAGRGSLRGRRIQTDLEMPVVTKPTTVSTKKGVSGRPISLYANYFQLKCRTDWCLYQYRVDFSVEEDRTYVRKNFLKYHKRTIGAYIFDGTVMYTTHRLYPEPLRLTTPMDSKKIDITIKLVGRVGIGDNQYIQFFNILMRMCYDGLKLQLVGRDFYDASPQAAVKIHDHRLELWPGYKTSIRQHESSILMCAEITHKVMRQETVLDVLYDCKASNRSQVHEEFEKRVIGTVVLTKYNSKTYRIDSVDWKQSPLTKFRRRKEEEISFLQYYKQKYDATIKDIDQPMLIHRAKEKDVRAGHSELCALVPELCRTTGLTDENRSNFKLMKAMADHTRVNPNSRIQMLQAFNKRLRTTDASMESLKEWQMELSESLVQFEGRILPPEKIVLGHGTRLGVNQDVDWTRDLRCSPMLKIVHIPMWTVLLPDRSYRDAVSFVKVLQNAANSMGLSIGEPQWHQVPDDRNATYTEALERIIVTGGTKSIIMCVVPNNRLDRYSAIKKKTCVDRAVATQVILAKNLSSKGVMSIATKVAIQMNCKVGGSPWSVEIPLKGLMVVGFDVCHDTSKSSMSYGALVASLDKGLTKYFSAVSHHSRGEELANDMVANVIKAIHAYKKYNSALPQRIIFYRDGVGDGQIAYVHNTEVSMLRQQIDMLYRNENEPPCKIAYVIVSKRINTRIFTLDGRNPLAGTVVDDVITLPERYDFFLVSQTVRQGTVAPTSYNVIYDTLGLEPDKIQRLTYKLTYLYFNWSGTCRVPAPCQYAHKLAFLVAQALHRSPNVNVEQSLYFL